MNETFTAGPMTTVEVTAPDIYASEADGDNATFAIERAGDVQNALTVPYTIRGSAVNGVDYQTIDNSVHFAAGETTAQVDVLPLADQQQEGLEYVMVSLQNKPSSRFQSIHSASGPLKCRRERP